MLGSGLKKPLNLLVAPVYPDIKRTIPRFVWSRKHWQVDVGATTKETEPYTNFIEPAVLAQSRDYNKTVYGQPSDRNIVNAAFRPPLISYYEDIGPLSRVPTKIEPVIPNINIGTADHGGFAAMNNRVNITEKTITDKVKNGVIEPTFYAPMDLPADNSVLPDLELKLPSVTGHAGWVFPSYNTQESPDIDLGDEKLQAVPIQAGYTPNISMDGPHGFENYETVDNRPSYSATSGVNTPIEFNAPVAVETFELLHNRPQISASAGINPQIQLNSETPTVELFHNLPQTSASAGINTQIHLNSETPDIELSHNRPQTSVSSGINTQIRFDAETPTAELLEKLGETPIYIPNPVSETGYKTTTTLYSDEDQYIKEAHPSFSYSVPPEDPAFRTRNETTLRPHFQEKLQPLKSYGQISQTGAFIPRAGVEMYRESLRDSSDRRKPNKYEVQKKKVRYRF